MNKPRGEKALHYASVICIRSRYPHTTIAPTLWKHQHAHYARLDNSRKRYAQGNPELYLKYKKPVNGDGQLQK